MNFDPSKRYGGCVASLNPISRSMLSRAKAALAADDFIPSEYLSRVKWFVTQPDPDAADPLHRMGFITWKYQPKIREVAV